MNLRIASFMAAALLAATAPSFADEFDDFDNDETTSSTDNGSAAEYDGSAASEFADDAEYAAEYAQYKKEKTSKAEINRQPSTRRKRLPKPKSTGSVPKASPEPSCSAYTEVSVPTRLSATKPKAGGSGTRVLRAC